MTGILEALFALMVLAISGVLSQPLFDDMWTISSVNGTLDVYLIDELRNVTVNGEDIELRVWNSTFTGPLLKVKRGDKINIYLENRLDQGTNLHFHGFHVSPQIPADDSLFKIFDTNQIKLYSFDIPHDHPQGLFWYHSHAMPDSEYQIFNGMSGGFVIEGLLDEVPEFAALTEKIILLRDIQIFNGSIPAQPDLVGENPDTFRVVNGVLFPNLTCGLNETQIWSVANIGADIPYLLSWIGPNGDVVVDDVGNTFSPDVKVWLIARDGVLMNQKIPVTDSYRVGPSNRASFLVQCPSWEANVKLVNLEFTNGFDIFPFTEMLQLDYNAAPVSEPISVDVQFPAKRDYRESEISTTRTIVFTEIIDDTAVVEPNGEIEGSFFINGKAYQKGRIDIRTFLGSIERWNIINLTPEAHYFHIHQGFFQVVSVNGVEVPFTGYVDTVFIPEVPEGATNQTVEILMPFDDPLQVGQFVFHCHIEAHADGGMMATMEVIASAQPDIVFIAISMPLLFFIWLGSAGVLLYEWRLEKRTSASVDSLATGDEATKRNGEVANIM